MYLLTFIIGAAFFLFGTFVLTAVSSAFRRLHKRETKRQLQAVGNLFFYKKLHHFFFPNHEFEGIFFVAICAQNITRFGYGVCALAILITSGIIPFPFPELGVLYSPEASWFNSIISLLFFLILSFFIGEFIPRFVGARYPEVTIKASAPFASLFMVAVFPFAALFLKLAKSLWHTVYFDYLHEPQARAKQELIDMIQEADISVNLDPVDKKLIGSVMGFRERIAREIMVPRVNVFSLPDDTTIKEAAKVLENEGYSRTPVYHNTVDDIVGVLMYKDITRKFMQYEENGHDASIIEAPISTIVKNVLYTPETKKISHLLQEFRKKQVHLAIVVDEYGGTEGIVTIEDILEEIVGEIEDEYDDEEDVFTVEADGTWIADAKMSIIDVDQQLGLKIPQEGDYDTIGGYIYHRAGTIPSKGFAIYHDDFMLEVIKSNERSVEKVRITPIESNT